MATLEALVYLAGAAFLVVGVFLALRRVVLWYWRVNAALALMDEMAGTLRRIEALVAQARDASRATPVPPPARPPRSGTPPSP